MFDQEIHQQNCSRKIIIRNIFLLHEKCYFIIEFINRVLTSEIVGLFKYSFTRFMKLSALHYELYFIIKLIPL